MGGCGLTSDYNCRYNAITMVFTVPSDAAGLYFLSTHVVTEDGKSSQFLMKKNTEALCGFFEDNRSSPGTDGSASCSITTLLNSGKFNYNVIKMDQTFFLFLIKMA